jgi:hypothetical protein
MERPPLAAVGHEVILERLHAGGATALKVTGPPLWIIGQAPSGQRFQLFWWASRRVYQVTRRPPGQRAPEVLGTFPDWEAAVACALGA